MRRPGTSRLAAAIALALATGLAGCAGGIHTQVAREPDADLSRYRSFAVLPIGPTDLEGRDLLYGALSEDALEAAAARALEARGYEGAPPDAADLLVRVRARTRDRVYEAVRPSAAGGGLGIVRVRHVVREGTIAVDVLEAVSGRRVWGGRAVARIAEPARLGRRIEAGVAAILARHPLRVAPLRPR